MHKYRETMNDSSYDGSCTLCRFRTGSYNISGRLVFVGQNVCPSFPCTIVFFFL